MTLDRQLVFRVDEELYDFLKDDAEKYGRTIAQSARFYLKRILDDPPKEPDAPRSP